MDITPVIAETQQLIQGYGHGGFRIAETEWNGSVLVLPAQTQAWDVSVFSEISLATLQPLITHAAEIELLVSEPASMLTMEQWGEVEAELDSDDGIRLSHNDVMLRMRTRFGR